MNNLLNQARAAAAQGAAENMTETTKAGVLVYFLRVQPSLASHRTLRKARMYKPLMVRLKRLHHNSNSASRL